jgi:hypothetical protein
LVGSALPETPVGRAARDTQAAAYSPAMRNMPSSERQVYIETLEKIRGGENLSITDRVLAEQLRQMGREMSTKEADPLPEYPPVSGRVQNPIRPVDTGKYSDGGLLKGIVDDD